MHDMRYSLLTGPSMTSFRGFLALPLEDRELMSGVTSSVDVTQRHVEEARGIVMDVTCEHAQSCLCILLDDSNHRFPFLVPHL